VLAAKHQKSGKEDMMMNASQGLGTTESGPDPVPSGSSVQRHRIEFTGSGSEYFRIWIVNLLLTVLTLGLYYPWAKVRKLKYMYSNTHVAGHALDFHGSPKQMLRGFLLMVALFGAYSFAGTVSKVAGGIAGLALAAIWPALLRASLRFRLANTSWRGLRFAFTGSLGGAYGVFGKPLLMALGLGGVGALLLRTHTIVGSVLSVIFFLGIYALIPYLYFSLKRYQHEHYAYAQLQTQFRATLGDVTKVYVKAAGMGVLCMLGVALVGGLLALATGAAGALSGGSIGFGKVLILAPFFVIALLLAQVAPIPYFQSQMQNLLWSQTGSPLVRFKSDLGFGALFRQTLTNWALIVVTLGLYWPFALIASTRLKLQAVTIHMRLDPDTLVAQVKPEGGIGIGDAAADLAGIDIGL
jgi:uncharacterized membrane protein YjgN (DUF898 family)